MQTYLLRFLLAFIALTAPLYSLGQVTLTLRQPSPVQFWVDQLWNADAVNNSNQPLEVLLEATITNNSAQPLVQLTSQPLTLNKGYQNINSKRVVTDQIRYFDYPNIELVKQTNSLPFGEYVLCLRILQKSNRDELANNCLEYRFSPLTPPVLLFPQDGEVVTLPYPILTWFPPTPIQTGLPITYDLKLVEVAEGQSPQDALNRNLTTLYLQDITQTQQLYPSNAQPLEVEKVYAWQVIARYQRFNLGATEIWSFRYEPEGPVQVTSEDIYPIFAIPSTNMDAAFTQAVNVLNFTWNEPYRPGPLNYVILDKEEEQVKLNLPLQAKKGDNRYTLDLKATGAFKHKQDYLLIVNDLNGEQWYLKFKYFEE